MEVVFSTTEGTLGYILNHRQKRAIQSSHVHRSRLSHQVSLGWCRASLCDPPHHEGFSTVSFPTMCLHRPWRRQIWMLEMVVHYHLGYGFRYRAPKEAQSGKWSLSLDSYPWERSTGYSRGFPGPSMLQTSDTRGKANHAHAWQLVYKLAQVLRSAYRHKEQEESL